MTALKRIRLSRGMTQVELASKSNVDRTLIIALEQGRGNPTKETLEKLAAALNCSVAELIEK